MNDIKEILKQYPIYDIEDIILIRWNENKTYHIVTKKEDYLFRIHESIPDFDESPLFSIDKKDKIVNELNSLQILFKNGLPVQRVILNKKNEVLSLFKSNTYCSILTYIPGETLQDKYKDYLKELGEMIANIHMCGKGINNYSINYNEDMVDSLILKLNNSNIEEKYKIIIENTLIEIKNVMLKLRKKENQFGFIHSDLSFSNIILSNKKLFPIDFSLSGFGFYAHDLGQLFCNINECEERQMILKSYENKMNVKINIHDIDAFFCLSIILYIILHLKILVKQENFTNRLKKWSTNYFDKLINKIEFSC